MMILMLIQRHYKLSSYSRRCGHRRQMQLSKVPDPTLLHNGRVMTLLLKRRPVRTFLGAANADSPEIARATTDTINFRPELSQLS